MCVFQCFDLTENNRHNESPSLGSMEMALAMAYVREIERMCRSSHLQQR